MAAIRSRPIRWMPVAILAAWVLSGGHAVAGASLGKPDPGLTRCDNPLRLHVRRLATAKQPAQHQALDFCSGAGRQTLAAGSPAPGLDVQLGPGPASFVLARAALGSSLRAEQQLRPDGREYPVSWRGGGPPIQLRVARIRDAHPYAVHADGGLGTTLVNALAKDLDWQIDGLEALGALRVTLDFDLIPAESVLILVADHASLQVQKLGPRHYRIGQARHRAQIQALEARLPESSAEREPLLRQIVQLASDPDAPGLDLAPAAALQDLAEIALRREQFPLARDWWRMLLDWSARAEGVAEPEVRTLTHAEWLAGLARVEMADGQPAAARALLERGLAIVQHSAGPQAMEAAPLLAQLSILETDPATAFAAIQRAVQVAEWNGAEPDELLPLLEQAAALHERTGAWADAAQLRQQILLYEHGVQGRSAVWLSDQRQRLATALEKAGRYQQASEAWQQLLDHSADPALQMRAWRGMAELAIAGGAPERALICWTAVREQRLALLGASHMRTRAADLELAAIAALAAQLKGASDPDRGLPALALRALPPTPAPDAAMEALPLALRLEFGIDLLTLVHQRIGDDLDYAPNMPVAARAGRLEFRAELALALDGAAALDAARRDYAAALSLRQKADPRGQATLASAARLHALEAQR